MLIILNQDGDHINCIKWVLRIKNGFKDCHKWFKSNDISKFNYCDIKMNVLIESDKLGIVGEIQFLLKWMTFIIFNNW